ncbi:hypothetical protein DOK78_000633 [Enterococcus sp. DIV2402]|uniref:Phage holin family protein n=1 Tax=Candidatus Enterococcus lowellii TaxID=2230877 RepID=A0ABZ2SLJ3_9ENTE|nr:hypothetical protein [Enterococcus sp. DIV2402]
MNKQNWTLILGLGALALIRPFFSIVGISELLGKPMVSIGATILITVIWVLVAQKTADPIITLGATGVTYGVLAILLSAVLSPMLLGQVQGPILSIYSIISVLMTNLIWGLVAGIIAKILQSIRR